MSVTARVPRKGEQDMAEGMPTQAEIDRVVEHGSIEEAMALRRRIQAVVPDAVERRRMFERSQRRMILRGTAR